MPYYHRLKSHSISFDLPISIQSSLNTVFFTASSTTIVHHSHYQEHTLSSTKKHDKRASWTPYGIYGWYICPSLLQYHRYKCHIPATNSQRDSETVAFFPHNFPMLRTSLADATTNAALDLNTSLQNPSPASPFDVSITVCVHYTN